MLDFLKNDRSWRVDLTILGLVFAVLFAIGLGNYPLQVPDEARYSEIPREMVLSGDYVTPRLNGVKYFEKPPLFYWLQASAIKAFGLNEWSLRFWVACLGVIGCLATYAAGRQLFGRQTGVIAAGVLATSVLYFVMAHTITLDMAVSVLMSAALLSFLCAQSTTLSGKQRWLLYMVFYIFCALSVLTKGLMGLVLPGAIIFLWMVLTKRWVILKQMHLIQGILLFLLVAAPWHILAQIRNPEFTQFYIVEQQFLRYLTDYANRYQPAWFFIPILLMGFFPWSCFIWQLIKQGWNKIKAPQTYPQEAFLIIWIVFIFVFFSVSKSKLVPYILPVFPALALLFAQYVVESFKNNLTINLRKPFLFYMGLAAAGVVGLVVAPLFISAHVPHADIIPRLLYVLAVLMAVSGGLVWWFVQKRQQLSKALLVLALTGVAGCWVAMWAWPSLNDKSTKTLALQLLPHLKHGDVVAVYDAYYQDLPVYLDRTITVVHPKGELEWGTHQRFKGYFELERHPVYHRYARTLFYCQ